MRTLALAVMFASTLAFAKEKATTPCTAYFMLIEQDDLTENLKMSGLNNAQLRWYQKDGGGKEYSGVCALLPNNAGKRVPAESLKDSHMPEPDAGKPVYVVGWHLTKSLIPDNSGGHYAYYASGILSRMGDDPEGNLIPIGPVHDTSRTIMSDPTISFLKAVMKQIKAQ